MTHEELEKLAVDICNSCSYEHYSVGDDSRGVKNVMELLTTYRAQVLEEVEGKIIELEFSVRDSGEYGAGMYQAYDYAKDSIEELKHPTN